MASEVAVSTGSSSRSVLTLRPTPMTAVPPLTWTRIPASFSSPISTSLGHLRTAARPLTAVTASATATPVSNDSQPHPGGGTLGRTATEKSSPAPRGETQDRSKRPRPPRWCSATRTDPVATSGRLSRSALVDSVSSTTSSWVHMGSSDGPNPGRIQGGTRRIDHRSRLATRSSAARLRGHDSRRRSAHHRRQARRPQPPLRRGRARRLGSGRRTPARPGQADGP